VLPAERRVRRRQDFSAVVRTGRRVSAPGLVVHVKVDKATRSPRVGFIVGRAVGTAVTRNRLRRQLRHLLAPRLSSLADGADLVVRVTPAAAGLSRRELTANVDQVVGRIASSAAAS
jgi:ribonuclease P protein component